MESTNNNSIIIGLLALIVGLLLGYFFGVGAMGRGIEGGMGGMMNMMGGDSMFEEMGEHKYGEELIDGDGAMSHAMDEMMLGFRGLEGEAYEEMFLRGMIVHHLGAIEMAEELLKQTDRPELVTLGNNIIKAQTEEVSMMKGWLNTWFGESR